MIKNRTMDHCHCCTAAAAFSFQVRALRTKRDL